MTKLTSFSSLSLSSLRKLSTKEERAVVVQLMRLNSSLEQAYGVAFTNRAWVKSQILGTRIRRPEVDNVEWGLHSGQKLCN